MKQTATPLTIAQAAELAGVSQRHLFRLIAAGTGPLRRLDGGFDCAAIGAWLAQRTGGGDGERLDAEQERARLARQQRIESEQRVAIRSRELMPTDLAVQYFAEMASVLVAQLKSWPGRLAPALHEVETVEEVAHLLDLAADDIRHDLDEVWSRAAAAFRERHK